MKRIRHAVGLCYIAWVTPCGLSPFAAWLVALAAGCGTVCCARGEARARPASEAAAAAKAKAKTGVSVPRAAVEPAIATVGAATLPAQLDPNGDDDPPSEDIPAAPLLPGHFERVGRAPAALQRICDLTPLGGALFAAHATRPLGLDGASVTRYQPDEKQPFSLAFDWNRAGEPSKGGGAGQGFLRVHAIFGRLFVPDADPPYNGFGISEPGTEGFVFVSTPEGKFAAARMPGHRPPLPPAESGKAGASVLPRAYHVLDAIRFRGHVYAATGAVPPGQRAWHGASPGALLVEPELGARYEYAADYPNPYLPGVWRLTFLVRFKDRLYAGLQDYDQREPNDYLYFAPPPERAIIAQQDVRAARVTRTGTSQTLRWYADNGSLYWIAWNSEGVGLRVTSDGDSWRVVDLPRDEGVPTDIVRFRGALHVLTTRALLRLDETGPTVLAHIADKRSPFELDDSFCAAPLSPFRGELYAGGQRDGALYRFREGN